MMSQGVCYHFAAVVVVQGLCVAMAALSAVPVAEGQRMMKEAYVLAVPLQSLVWVTTATSVYTPLAHRSTRQRSFRQAAAEAPDLVDAEPLPSYEGWAHLEVGPPKENWRDPPHLEVRGGFARTWPPRRHRCFGSFRLNLEFQAVA